MIRIDLRDADAVIRIADELTRAGRQSEAARLLSRALDANPGDAALAFRLGLKFASLKSPEDAKEAYRRALAADETHVGALNNLAALHVADGAPDLAIPLFERASAQRPGDPQLAVNLANAHYDCGNITEAEAVSRQIVAVHPEFSPAQSALGTALIAQGRPEEALDAFRRAIAIDPNNADDHSRLGMALLSLGRLDEGAAEFEWRWKAARFDTPRRDFPFPRWRGEPLRGKTILVWGEQGVGDEIVMSALVAKLVPASRRVLFECDPRLVPLVERRHPSIAAHPRSGHGRPPPPALLAEKVDYQIPAFDLIRYLAKTCDDLIPGGPALRADLDKREIFRRRYDAWGPGLKVGISWHSANRRRARESPALTDWGPILGHGGIHFVDLQYGNRADERAAAARAFGVDIHYDASVDSLTSLDDFAAQIMALDLIITTANTTADMAGALGVETWTMLPIAPDWRWFLDGDRVPWYPAMRVFRDRPGDTNGTTVERVGDALAGRLKTLS